MSKPYQKHIRIYWEFDCDHEWWRIVYSGPDGLGIEPADEDEPSWYGEMEKVDGRWAMTEESASQLADAYRDTTQQLMEEYINLHGAPHERTTDHE